MKKTNEPDSVLLYFLLLLFVVFEFQSSPFTEHAIAHPHITKKKKRRFSPFLHRNKKFVKQGMYKTEGLLFLIENITTQRTLLVFLRYQRTYER